MQTEEILKEAKSRFAGFRGELEEANVRAALAAGDARDLFEREWGKFSAFMEEQGNRLRRQGAWSGRLTERIMERLERLKALVIAELPTSERQYNSWREQTMRTIYELEFLIHDLNPVLDDDERDLFGTLRVKMELYRTNLVLTPYDQLGSLNAMAAAVATKADEVIGWRMRLNEAARERSERFREEIAATFSHLKGAFSQLFR